MTAKCCTRLAPSILPAAVLLFLPKCPMCLVAWLALSTGIGISAAGAAFLREGIVLACVAALVPVIRRAFQS